MSNESKKRSQSKNGEPRTYARVLLDSSDDKQSVRLIAKNVTRSVQEDLKLLKKFSFSS